jgi:hypothetical protein
MRRKQGGVGRGSCIVCSHCCGVGSSRGRCRRWGSGVGEGVVVIGSGDVAIDRLRGVVDRHVLRCRGGLGGGVTVFYALELAFGRRDRIYYISAILCLEKQ